MKRKKCKKSLSITPQERDVLKAIAEYEGYRTTREIAKVSGISWTVVYKFLHKLLDCGWINHVERGKWEYWKAVIR